MTTLYVANTSKQIHQFIYRRPESQATSPPLEIPPGQQRSIGTNLTDSDVDFIIRHHAKYGMVPAKEAAKTKDFVGLCYSVDKPISEDNLEVAFDHNEAVLNAIADMNRENTAVAISKSLEDTLESTHSPVKIGRVEVEVAQETKVGETQKVNAGVEVLPEGMAPRRGGRARKH